MRTRRILAVTAVCAASLLAGCGGDGENDDTDAASAPEEQADCQATVELTGAVKASWSGNGYVITGGGNQAFYKTSDGNASVSIIPGRDDQPATPIVATKSNTYTVQPDSEGVEVDADGGGATVDAEASGTKNGKPVTVHLVATFDC